MSDCWLLLFKLWARKTPLRKRLHGKEILSTKPRPRVFVTFFSVTRMRDWMACNRLKLNEEKTQIIWLGTRQQLDKVTVQMLKLPNATVPFFIRRQRPWCCA